MYKLYDGEGKLIGFSDEARFVKETENGYIKSDAEEADGISFQGNYYEGGGAVKTTEGISIEEIRAMLGLDEDAISEMLDMIADHEERLAALEGSE